MGISSPSTRKNRPTSTAADVTKAEHDTVTEAPQAQTTSIATQTLSTVPAVVSYEFLPTPTPAPEVISYSKAIQTSDFGSPGRKDSRRGFHDSDSDDSPSLDRSPRKSKRRSRREREREETLRQNLRKEIEEELSAAKKPVSDVATTEARYPARPLTNEELTAVTVSEDFLDFVERSSKVIERALDQDYNVLADYSLDGVVGVDSDEEEITGRGRSKKGRRIRQVAQFYDERWCKKRMISDIDFSSRVRNHSFRISLSPLMGPKVPRATTCFVHQKRFRSGRSIRLTTSLESPSPFTTRIHIPLYVRYTHSSILTLPSITSHRRFLQRADSAMGHPITLEDAISKDTSHRRCERRPYPSHLFHSNGRNSKRQ